MNRFKNIFTEPRAKAHIHRDGYAESHRVSVPARFSGGKHFSLFHCFFVSLCLFSLIACQPDPTPDEDPTPTVTVIASGLLNPVGMAVHPAGGLLIAEEGTGEDDLSAGVSLLTANGELGRFISNMPSGRDSGDLSGVPFVGLSPSADMLYLSHFNLGHLWSMPLDPDQPLRLPSTPYTAANLVPAMQPLNAVQVINPFDITFTPDGAPVVTDASANAVAREKPDGTTTMFHNFFEIAAPDGESFPVDPVPTGITRVGEDEYYVTLFGGCPYPANSGQLVALDSQRNERIVLDGLTMPIDVAQDPDGTIWLLQFAEPVPDADCFDGQAYAPNSGRLSRLTSDGELELVLDGLNFPGQVLPLADGRLLISEIFDGEILQVSFDQLSLPVSEPAVAPPLAEVPQPWQFRDATAEVGLNFQHGAFHLALSADPVAMMGAGLCWIDYDNDGWLDLYLINSHANGERMWWEMRSGLPTNALMRNENGRFTDVSEQTQTNLALRGNGCVAADFNLDGHTDLYITADGANKLLWNNGDGTFTEGAAAAGVAPTDWNAAAIVGDLNGDGWPDLYVGSYIDLENKIPNPSGAFPQDFYGLPDYLYLSEGLDQNGRITFRNVAAEVGLLDEGRGLGALFTDLDNDGDLDLYVANDGQRNRLYRNDPMPNDPLGIGFRFTDLNDTAGVGDSGSGMGIAGGDWDGDGWFDLFVTNWDAELNALYRNDMAESADLTFIYSTYRIGMQGLGANLTGWGTTWADFDHDGDSDLLVANGHVPVTDLEADAQLVRLYGNQMMEGKPGELRDWTNQSGFAAAGPILARGSATADFDNDGDLDVAINGIGETAVLLRNDAPPGNWLQVELEGFQPGATITLELPNGQTIRREVHAGSSYLASEDPRCHVGLGDVERISQLTVRWPNGATQIVSDVAVNQTIRLSTP